jgi:hypothetical protein
MRWRRCKMTALEVIDKPGWAGAGNAYPSRAWQRDPAEQPPQMETPIRPDSSRATCALAA